MRKEKSRKKIRVWIKRAYFALGAWLTVIVLRDIAGSAPVVKFALAIELAFIFGSIAAVSFLASKVPFVGPLVKKLFRKVSRAIVGGILDISTEIVLAIIVGISAVVARGRRSTVAGSSRSGSDSGSTGGSSGTS